MQALNLEVAGEFLVMASTLVYIKSKSLLPRHGDEEEEEDPEIMRQELSRRLIEYERFKEAAARLGVRVHVHVRGHFLSANLSPKAEHEGRRKEQ